MMYPIQFLNCQPSFEDPAMYFNSMTNVYQYSFSQMPIYSPTPAFFYYADGFKKINDPSERPTDDHDSSEQDCEEVPQVRLKEEFFQDDEWTEPKQASIEEKTESKPVKVKKAKSKSSKEPPKCDKAYRKNLESNLINNVFSYICSALKSHDVIQELLKSEEKSKIFYIFAQNLKKLNTKYLSRKNLKDICEIVPGKAHAKMLAKSVKRLQMLPMDELRSVLRRTLFFYLRSETSLMPLLTSKKLSKTSIRDHLKKRRDLKEYLVQEMQQYSLEKFEEST